MPFSFSRIFLGEKATTIDEGALPCQPRQIVPVAADDPVATKVKFNLTKIGRALKYKLRMDHPAPVPAGHGPLTLAADHPFSPFATRLKSPATVGLTTSLASLPHIPEISSTLGRDIRAATRNGLFASVAEANLQVVNKDRLDTRRPQLKRRTQSSSVLGAADLPRQRASSASSSYVNAPLGLSVSYGHGALSSYSSEYNEPAEVLSLGFVGRDRSPLSTPFVGCVAIEMIHPAPRRDWYVQQYVQNTADWSLEIMPASAIPSLLFDSSPWFSNLEFGSHQILPGSSLYPPFPSACDVGSKISRDSPFSPSRSGRIVYSAVKPAEKAEFLHHTVTTSPPAESFPREAQKDEELQSSFLERSEARSILLNDQDLLFANEKFFNQAEVDIHGAARATSTGRFDQFFEPRSKQVTITSIREVFAFSPGADREEVAVWGGNTANDEAEAEHFNDDTARQTFSTGTVLICHPQDETSHSPQELLVPRQLTRFALEAVVLSGPGRQVQIIADGAARVIAGVDLFISKDQYGDIETASVRDSSSSSTADNIRETSGTHPEQISLTEASSPVSDGFDRLFTREAYKTAVASIPRIADEGEGVVGEAAESSTEERQDRTDSRFPEILSIRFDDGSF